MMSTAALSLYLGNHGHFPPALRTETTITGQLNGNHSLEAHYVTRAANLSDLSSGFTSPHPNFGCVLLNPSGYVAGEGYLYVQGTKPAIVLALEAADSDACWGGTTFLNLEPGDCHGDHSAVSALVQAGVKRVVIGMRHPKKHLRGNAVRALKGQGSQVDVLAEDLQCKMTELILQ